MILHHLIYSHKNGFQNISSDFCRMFFIEWSVYNQVLLWTNFCLYCYTIYCQKVNPYMINSCRTWLIFPIWNISNLVLDGIYFPILSVKISIHNIIGGIWHHCYCCSTPTKCSVHYGYCHTCVFAFLMQLQHLDFHKSVYSKEWDPSNFCKSLIGISTKDVILPKKI